MSTRPARVTARVAPRPDVRRWILIAAAVAAAAAAFTSVVGAQAALAPSPAATILTESEQHHEWVPTADPVSAPPRAQATAAVGPRVSEGMVSYRPAMIAQRADLTANEREMNRPASRRSAALIVVGLSAMVIGSFVVDDAGSIIVLGGAGVTLYGLWQYLR